MGNPPARAALHLARAAAFLGHTASNHALVERGLMLAGSHATGLIHDLRTAETPITIMDKNIRIELT